MITTSKSLDETDKKIIAKVSEGLTAKETAYELNISRRSIEARIREMKRYYKCKNIAQLVIQINKNK